VNEPLLPTANTYFCLSPADVPFVQGGPGVTPFSTPATARTRTPVHDQWSKQHACTGSSPLLDARAAVRHGAFANPGQSEKTSNRRTTTPSNPVLEGLEEASRQQVLSARRRLRRHSRRRFRTSVAYGKKGQEKTLKKRKEKVANSPSARNYIRTLPSLAATNNAGLEKMCSYCIYGLHVGTSTTAWVSDTLHAAYKKAATN
jgi:hypothetical protein